MLHSWSKTIYNSTNKYITGLNQEITMCIHLDMLNAQKVSKAWKHWMLIILISLMYTKRGKKDVEVSYHKFLSFYASFTSANTSEMENRSQKKKRQCKSPICFGYYINSPDLQIREITSTLPAEVFVSLSIETPT